MSTPSQPPGQGPGGDAAARTADEAALTRLLERQSPLSAAIREAAGADAPPPQVDAAIRAAARRAVAAGPQALPAAGTGSRSRPWWQRARVPLAAAATVVLTVSVTQLVDREQRERDSADGPAIVLPSSVRPSPGSPSADTVTAAPAPSAEAPAVAKEGRQAQSRPAEPAPRPEAVGMQPPVGMQPRTADRAAGPASAADNALRLAAPSPAPSSAPPPPSVAEAVPAAPAVVTRAASASEPSAAPARKPAVFAAPAQAPPPGATADRAARAQQAALPPDRWLQEILELRRSGRVLEAAEALAAFRKAWPDHPLPPELSLSPP